MEEIYDEYCFDDVGDVSSRWFDQPIDLAAHFRGCSLHYLFDNGIASNS